MLSTRKVIIASTLCGICTGIICSILWLAISGVNWFGSLVINLVFLTNAVIGGIIGAFILHKFKKCPITVGLYIGNTLPIGIFLLYSYITADPSTEAWSLIFLIGWLIISSIPAAITSSFIKR